jgi:LasA protease
MTADRGMPGKSRDKVLRVKSPGNPEYKFAFFLRGFVLIFVFIFTACQSTTVAPTPAPRTPNTSTPTTVPTLEPTLAPSQTPTPSPLPPSPTPSPIPWPPAGWLFPDSEVIYGPSASDFDVLTYLDESAGFLSTYRQYLMVTKWTSGADLISMVALENSINPRLLLALLEYQSGCVLGDVDTPEEFSHAMGAALAPRADLYGQLVWAVHQLSEGYYGWKEGTLSSFTATDGRVFQPAPTTNPGTVALQYFFAQLYDQAGYTRAIGTENEFLTLYEEMFGGPWARAVTGEPLIPATVEQPELTLPFEAGKAWALTGGPHKVHEGSGPLGALDFAPPTDQIGCYQSEDWIIAMADGLIVRSEFGVVIQDLDEDGNELTGWVIMYMHIEERDRIPVGMTIKAGYRLGHPSCEGGRATGTHTHIARKYNGEWIPADGTIPFVMNGWQAHNGKGPYLGTLTRGDQVVTAHQYGSYISRIERDENGE